MAEIEIKEPITNTVTEIRRKEEGKLIVEQTPKTPVTKTTTYNITDIQRQIDKINGVIKLWENKKAPLQTIIDEYTEIK